MIEYQQCPNKVTDKIRSRVHSAMAYSWCLSQNTSCKWTIKVWVKSSTGLKKTMRNACTHHEESKPILGLGQIATIGALNHLIVVVDAPLRHYDLISPAMPHKQLVSLVPKCTN
eukprot:COSAG01_NODE_119_length_25410_cov_1333.312275_4_plen_114_part_00